MHEKWRTHHMYALTVTEAVVLIQKVDKRWSQNLCISVRTQSSSWDRQSSA